MSKNMVEKLRDAAVDAIDAIVAETDDSAIRADMQRICDLCGDANEEDWGKVVDEIHEIARNW